MINAAFKNVPVTAQGGNNRKVNVYYEKNIIRNV